MNSEDRLEPKLAYFTMKNGTKLYGYTAYLDYDSFYWYSVIHSSKWICSRDLIEKIYTENELKNLPGFVDVVPPKGSSLYVAPKCKYSMDDIRKNYTIKRGIDNGDYNVFTPISNYRGMRFRTVLICKSKKLMYFADKRAGTKYESAKLLSDMSGLPIKPEDVYVYEVPDNHYEYFYTSTADTVYTKLFDGSIKKPCVIVDKLNVNSSDELTDDAVFLFFETGKQYYASTNAEQNMIIQTNALNSFNWRRYPQTMSMVLNILYSRSSSIYRDMYGHTSKFSKSVAQVLDFRTEWDKVKDLTEEEKQKDFECGRRFLMRILNIQDKKFASFCDVRNKFIEYSLDNKYIDKYLNCVVRIMPKEYEKTS